jgi:glycosyltransferase involved in cell wall biosynthesis
VIAESNMMCVPLKKNFYASGITVIEEGVISGIPVIATDTGGLRSYFGPEEILFVHPGDCVGLRTAIETLAADPLAACEMAKLAQTGMTIGMVGAETYIRDLVRISDDILRAKEK